MGTPDVLEGESGGCKLDANERRRTITDSGGLIVVTLSTIVDGGAARAAHGDEGRPEDAHAPYTP
jgi:hypothetical protein